MRGARVESAWGGFAEFSIEFPRHPRSMENIWKKHRGIPPPASAPTATVKCKKI